MVRDVLSILDPALTIAAAAVVGATVAHRRAARRRLCAAALKRLTRILEASPSEVALLLGISSRTLERWMARGVDDASHGDVIHLLRTALALRECFTPSATRRLLLLRQRRISQTARDYRILMLRARARARSGEGVIITVR